MRESSLRYSSSPEFLRSGIVLNPSLVFFMPESLMKDRRFTRLNIHRNRESTFIIVLFPLPDSPMNTVNGRMSFISMSTIGPKFSIRRYSFIIMRDYMLGQYA